MENTNVKLKDKKIGVISLGCDKNRVDLEKMIAKLRAAKFEIVGDIEEAEIILINTCAFIKVARTESVFEIMNAIKEKNRNCEKIIVTGCLSNKNKDELKNQIPEIDAVVTTDQNDNIVDIIYELYGKKFKVMPYMDEPEYRALTTPKHYAYLKIADGCNNFCSYCTIPFIRGRYRSEKMEDILEEAKWLASIGVKELILVAQDVSRYGKDLYKKEMIVPLLEELSKIDGIKWIRLLYCYPEKVTKELIEEIKNNPKVCNYIDIPFQHISEKILYLMNRRSTKNQILELVEDLHKNDIKIRSTFIVGFPGEKREHNRELKEFLKKNKLENVGFFTYSREEGTSAGKMKMQVPEFKKKFRLRKLQKLQWNVASQINAGYVGKEFEVIVDELGKDYAIGRTYFMNPDVDGTVIISNIKSPILVGDFVKVKIIDNNGVDLIAEPLN